MSVPKPSESLEVKSADELRDIDPRRIQTTIAHKEYLYDCLFTVVLQVDGDGTWWQIDELIIAMKEPVFMPYLGRKSCPLGVLMQPQEIEADSVIEALKKAEFMSHGYKANGKRVLHWEEGMNAGINPVHIRSRTDSLVSRSRHQFKARQENEAYI